MEINNDVIRKYQQELKDQQELSAYCNKINQGMDSLSIESGKRAIWELVQNARDQSDEACICIHLHEDKLVFSHRGQPFDYRSLLALVNQNSSKDDPDTDLAGQYGTGFMTTHAFSDIVDISGPFQVMTGNDNVLYYVLLNGFKLDRSSHNNRKEAIKEMRKEMDAVAGMYLSDPKYYNLTSDISETSFTYALTAEKVTLVSEQLKSISALVPIVLVINDRIKQLEIVDDTTRSRMNFNREGKLRGPELFDKGYQKFTDRIAWQYNGQEMQPLQIHSLRPIDNGDIVIIPPLPECCPDVSLIPSLFLWFPLLGTENFGVNFIFHSRRFFPVEKRNNIMLPESTDSKLVKGKHNEYVLHEMMEYVFDYYSNPDNCTDININFAQAHFMSDNSDAVTIKFYEELQSLWARNIVDWKVIPTVEGLKSINDGRMRVLHPEFYRNLDDEQRRAYEPIFVKFAHDVKTADGNSYLLPSENLICWSETVDRWSVGDPSHVITINDVCLSIKDKSDELKEFIKFLIESKNENMLSDHPLLPSRNGTLHPRRSLSHGNFITDILYELACPLLGREIEKIIDPAFVSICPVNDYTVENFRGAIRNTIESWRKDSVGQQDKKELSMECIKPMFDFCSAFFTDSTSKFRFKMMGQIASVWGFDFKPITLPKLTKEEDDLYGPTFNLLVDVTLFHISQENNEWINANKSRLFDFLNVYVGDDGLSKEHKEKLDIYEVIPNQNGIFCTLNKLRKNNEVPDVLTDIYHKVTGIDLRSVWIDPVFESLFILEQDVPKKIANAVQYNENLKTDIQRARPTQFRDVLKEIILLLNDEQWATWFDDIDKNKQAITFKLQSGPAQKSLFSLMDLDDENLAKLATIKEDGEISMMLEYFQQHKDNERDAIARFNHLQAIGKHIEETLRERIGQDHIQLCWKKEFAAEDVQNGQDIIVKVKKGDEWIEIYYIEVKSKWDFNIDSAHMSSCQIRKASNNPDHYALCCVDLRPYKHENLVELSADKIIAATRVKIDIGFTLKPMMEKILEAEKRPDETQIKITEYRSNISAEIFGQGARFDILVEDIERIVRETLSNG